MVGGPERGEGGGVEYELLVVGAAHDRDPLRACGIQMGHFPSGFIFEPWDPPTAPPPAPWKPDPEFRLKYSKQLHNKNVLGLRMSFMHTYFPPGYNAIYICLQNVVRHFRDSVLTHHPLGHK